MIGHLIQNYLEHTQVALYNYLTNVRNYPQVVLTDFAQNLNDFPHDCVYLLNEKKYQELEKQYGSKTPNFIQSFFHKLDYPNCFEDYIQKNNIQLLHAHFGGIGHLALQLKQTLNLPLVTSFYGIDASSHLEMPEMASAFQTLFQQGEIFTVLGSQMHQRLIDAGCPKEKLYVLHIGVDTETIPFSVRKKARKDHPTVLLFCGRLVEKKGPLLALEAFANAATQYTNLEFHMIGEGPLKGKLKSKIAQLGLKHRVKLLGSVSHKTYLKKLCEAHLFILPSITASDGDMEGTPTVLLEAQASGLPVISTFHADIPEIVVENQTGFLAPENDVAVLTNHLTHLVQHSEIWGPMGVAGHKHVKTNYNIQTEAAKLETLYKALI